MRCDTFQEMLSKSLCSFFGSGTIYFYSMIHMALKNAKLPKNTLN